MTEIGAFERTSAAAWARPERAILAYRAVVVALVAGVGETLGRAAIALDAPDVQISGIALGLAIRAAIYLTVFALAARMLLGSLRARGILVVGLGTVGLASLVVEPLGAILSADHPGDLFTGWTPNAVILGLFRAIHILAVLVAVPAAIRAGNRADRES
ncbi:hypothetical protein [Nocardia seriolae]|nr:hypothetical protein [Nocardia seriolae]MTJ66013.1 hypothetical protein [Nocardia seriolae]MTJ75788.1 hypothetical protein [Nocardia seriolae]MTJ86063.1 hypothetical protein [Nocardia seriolae]MTK30058.1 hypothetical protein [Nocardia seriolae]MTK44014.1 hypothetical protein [Nocardia seriolae]